MRQVLIAFSALLLILLFQNCNSFQSHLLESRDSPLQNFPDKESPYQYKAGAPVIFFSDLTAGPNHGWSSSEPNKGAVVTLWGKGFASSRQSSFVKVSGVKLSQNSDYPEAWGELGKPLPFLQRISFFLNSSVPIGAGGISVTVDGLESNSVSFRVNDDGRIFFVDINASTSGSGAHGDPWSNPSSFIDTMSAGDTVYFREGIYDQKYNGGKQNIWIRSSEASGTEERPIAFVAYPGEQPMFDALTNGTDDDFHTSFNFQNTWTTVSKMKMRARSSGVQGGSYSRIVGNDLIGGQVFHSGTGIIVVGGDGAKVLGNAVHGGSTANRLDHAIYINGCSPNLGVELGWNYSYDNNFDRGPMLVVNHQENRCSSSVYLKSHYIHDNVVDCTKYPSRGIGLFDQSWDDGDENEPETTYVYNNIVNACGTSTQPAMYQNSAHGAFFNNTIYNSQSSGFYVSGSRVITSKIHNNIIHLANTDHLYIDDDTQGVLASHNLYYGAGIYPGMDADAVNQEPLLLINSENGIFNVLEGSPSIDKGNSSIIDFLILDFNGYLRETMDIGALEFID